MTTIFDATRKQVKPNRTFGQGIAPARRTIADVTTEDRQWAAETSPYRDMDYDVIEPVPSDAELDDAAGCALAQARLDAGFVGFF